MARRRQYEPLRVYQNNRLVGDLLKKPSGAIEFRYDESWLDNPHAYPVSLSLPLREDAYHGEPVIAVFDNLLPDSDALRRRVAEKVGADGADAYSLLAAIGKDCVGALQFLTEKEEPETDDLKKISGEPVDEQEIETLLKNLAQAPLGLNRDDAFRISVAGAQEKTALLRIDGKWFKPHGTTPTTHILKTPIGQLPNGMDLTNSVENEYFCLKLAEGFGLTVNQAEMHIFGETKALVVERFDRRWSRTNQLLRIPQEDCCQALSVPSTRKYEREGGPGIAEIIYLLKGSDVPAEDLKTFFTAQILFWLIGATDGHAKNFSIFLLPGGGFRMTPLYDLLTAQPSLVANQIKRNQMKLAMCIGKNRHYRIDDLHARHYIQTGTAAGLSKTMMTDVIERIADSALATLDDTIARLPQDFPAEIIDAVTAGIKERIGRLRLVEDSSS